VAVKNRGSLVKTLARVDRGLKGCSESIENDSTWTLNSADTQELAQTGRQIARLQLSMMKLSRELLGVSREIRTLIVGTVRRLTMPARTRREGHLGRKNETSRQRFAFAAVNTENGAYVARVREDTSQVWPQKEYGRFESWTQAQGFAAMLNQRYGLDVVEAQHIVVSASLAAAKCRGQKA
jgi:hypothetical protein